MINIIYYLKYKQNPLSVETAEIYKSIGKNACFIWCCLYSMDQFIT